MYMIQCTYFPGAYFPCAYYNVHGTMHSTAQYAHPYTPYTHPGIGIQRVGLKLIHSLHELV